MNGELEQRLEWWREAGLITDDQAHRILEQEGRWAAESARTPSRAPRSAPRRLPSIVEGLGYIGGILTLVGAVLLVASYWDDMSSAGRLGLGVGSAVVLLVGGLLVHETDPALVRLRWALWTLSTIAAAVTIAITLRDGVDDLASSAIVLVVALVVAVENAILWAGRRRPIQQFLAIVSLPVIAGSATALLVGDTSEPPIVGIVVAVVGLAILLVGMADRTVFPAMTDGIGAAALILGATGTIEGWKGPAYILALLVVAAVLGVAVAPRPLDRADERLTIGIVGLVGLWQLVPMTIVYFAQDAGFATGLVVAVIGVALLAVGRRAKVSAPVVLTLLGGAAVVGGIAITATQSVAFATLAGLVVALFMIGLGTRPGWAIMSVFGAVGLLVNAPWAISWFFPGEGRAPLLIAVAGVVIIGVAVLLASMRGRIRREFDQPTSAVGGTIEATAPRP